MLTISPSIRLARSQDGGVVLDVNQGTMFSVNQVGARVIELLSEGPDLQSLSQAIGSEFHVSPESVRGDITEFLAVLRDEHLLVEPNDGNRAEHGGG